MAKTVTYTYVLQKACELTGRVYPPTTEEASFFRTFIGTALRQAWESWDWPEQVVVQQEFFAPTFSLATTYSAGDFVYWPTTEKYYQFIYGTPTAGQPPTYDLESSAVLSLESGDYLVMEDGNLLLVDDLESGSDTLNSQYWIEARPYPSQNGSQTYSAVDDYEVGDVVLYLTDRNYYVCHTAPSAGTLPTNTAYFGQILSFIRTVNQQLNPDGTVRSTEIGEIFSVYRDDYRRNPYQTLVPYGFDVDGMLIELELPWVWIEFRKVPPVLLADPSTIPYRFADVCAYRAAGQMLRVDGKVDLGNEFLQLGEAALTDEVDKFARQEMQTRQIVVATR